MPKATPPQTTRIHSKEARSAASGLSVPPEEAVTEPMLRGPKPNETDSGPHPRLTVATHLEKETLTAVSLEIGADDATLILPRPRPSTPRTSFATSRVAAWAVFGSSVVVFILLVSVPTGFALGHLLTENASALTETTVEEPTTSERVVLADTEHPAGRDEAGTSQETEGPLFEDDTRPPFVNETKEPSTPAEPSTANLDDVWAMVSRKPEQAKSSFEQHLETNPGDPEGHYGLGYLYLKGGQRELAGEHLCRARSAVDEETARDVRQLLKRNRLPCGED